MMLKSVFAICMTLGLGAGLAHATDTRCQKTSSRMLDHLDQGDYSGATADFDQRMKAALGADKLAEIWPAIAQKFGPRGPREPARPGRANGYALVVTPLHYGKNLVDAQVACDADGKVAGFYIKPHS